MYYAAGFLEAWLKSKVETIAERSLHGYQKAVFELIGYLGTRAAMPVDTVTAKEVRGFREAMLAKVSPSTANKNLLILRGAWTWGSLLALVTGNPFKAVGLVTNSDKHERRAFTLDELRVLLAACDREWKTLALLGLYTGQRLGDVATFVWRQVNFEQGEIEFLTQKTGRRMKIPMAKPLAAHLLTLPSSDDPDRPIMPSFAEVDTNTLSRQFGELLVKAGLVKRETAHRKHGNGRCARRVK